VKSSFTRLSVCRFTILFFIYFYSIYFSILSYLTHLVSFFHSFLLSLFLFLNIIHHCSFEGTVGRWCDFPSHLTKDKKKPEPKCEKEIKEPCKPTNTCNEAKKEEANTESVDSTEAVQSSIVEASEQKVEQDTKTEKECTNEPVAVAESL
jgi:hypothetical protein